MTEELRKCIPTSNCGLPRAVNFTAQNPVQSVASGGKQNACVKE